ncbi:hypothetical protein ISS07_05590 [Candidatus Woesearchaeota archaeon]|nr:hypothetical protein [Candidatus Woesearchaeota archaeon]
MSWILGNDQESSKKKLKGLMDEVQGELSEEIRNLGEELRKINEVFNEYLRIESRIKQILDFPTPNSVPSIEAIEEIRKKIVLIKNEDQTVGKILSRIKDGLELQEQFLKRIISDENKDQRAA